MVKTDFYYDGDIIKGFSVQGHAGAAAPGRDLVCAAVSALTQTALLGLDAYLTGKILWKMDQGGYLECRLPDNLSAADWEKVAVLLGTLELGLKSMEESYGQYLKVGKRRWTACCSK